MALFTGAVRKDPYSVMSWKLLARTQVEVLRQPELAASIPGLRGHAVSSLKQTLALAPGDETVAADLLEWGGGTVPSLWGRDTWEGKDRTSSNPRSEF